MNRRALERALQRHYTEKFRGASVTERERLRSGFETSLFSWHGELVVVRSKGWAFYELIRLPASRNGPLKKIADL